MKVYCYIGETKDLKRRIGLIKRGLVEGTPDSCTHPAVRRYIWFGFSKLVKLEQIEVRWAVLAEEKCIRSELSLLNEYLTKYLDRPPLNSTIGRL